MLWSLYNTNSPWNSLLLLILATKAYVVGHSSIRGENMPKSSRWSIAWLLFDVYEWRNAGSLISLFWSFECSNLRCILNWKMVSSRWWKLIIILELKIDLSLHFIWTIIIKINPCVYSCWKKMINWVIFSIIFRILRIL